MRIRLAAALFGLVALTTACAQSDAGITTSVKSQLAADDLVKARNIDVDTNNRVVTLTASVQSEREETKALEIARATRGVVDVVDNLSVAAVAEPSAAPTTGRYGATGYPRACQVEKERALEIARGVENVAHVEDKLTVSKTALVTR